MSLPNKKEIQKALKKLKKIKGTLALPSNATTLDKFRWEICQKFIAYKQEHNITQRDMAEQIGVDEAKISKILHHRIDEFSTDRLVNLYLSLDNQLILKVG